MPGSRGCDLHIPYKDWSGDPHEERNYAELERWSIRIGSCLGGTQEGGVYRFPQLSRICFSDNPVPYGIGGTNWPTGRPDATSYYTVDWSLTHRDTDKDLGSGFTVSGDRLGVTDRGLLAWEGNLRYDFYNATTPPGRAHYMLWSKMPGWIGTEEMQRLTPLNVGVGNLGVRVVLGGGYYVSAGEGIELRIEQTSSFSHPIGMRLGFTLIRF